MQAVHMCICARVYMRAKQAMQAVHVCICMQARLADELVHKDEPLHAHCMQQYNDNEWMWHHNDDDCDAVCVASAPPLRSPATARER